MSDFDTTPTLERDTWRRAIWPLRLWGIRHVRYVFCLWRVWKWADHWARIGIGLGVPNDSDMRFLDEIWKGKQ